MKYYLIVGEASGDLHASHLMEALKTHDPEAEFRFFGGDNMSAAGGTRVKHYKELAYMGFIPVLIHLPTIMKNMALCKKDIEQWQPDVVIPVDYAGFNLSICKFLTGLRKRLNTTRPKTFYYIAPKIWAWKEYRIKNFKRDVQEMFCILPFEVDFFEKKHNYPVRYVGNPTADEVRKFKAQYTETQEDFCKAEGLNPFCPIVALLAGSRIQEIRDNLPAMLQAAKIEGYQYVIAGAPSIDDSVYAEIIKGHNVHIVRNKTYALLSHSAAALVTSGTATLETALFNVPQAVCYKTPMPHILRWAFNNIIKCKYISLVNLIADKEVVKELFADRFTIDNIAGELESILPGGNRRETILNGYKDVCQRLGDTSAPDNAARQIVCLLKGVKD